MNEHDQYQQGTFDLTSPEVHAPTEDAPSVTAMLPRDAAKALIRPYVLRGDPLDTLTGSLMGSAGADFSAQISGGMGVGEERTRVRRDQIGVSRIGTEPVAAIFSLTELYKEIRAEAEATPAAVGADASDALAVPEPTPAHPVDRPASQFHTLTSSSRRLSEGDFWPEYLHEVATRERLDLPDVSPDEFEDMRDWTDGYLAPADTAWPPQPERPPYVRATVEEWSETEGEDGDEDAETWADAPRGKDVRGRAETVFDARQARLDATIDLLTKKVEEMVTGEGYRAWLRMLARFHTYSANNVALILAQYPDATKVMGYGNKAGTTGWKSMGRFVKEGEKGIRIIRPMHATIRDDEDERAEPVKVLRGFTTATVFDIRQTEGKPLPHEPLPADLTADEAERSLELSVHLHRFIDAAGVRVVRDHRSTHRGSWKPDKREISLRADLTGVQALKTLAHETAHMLADHRHEGVAMADAETVAESVAFVLLDHYGIDTSGYSVSYIAGWARDPETVQRNLDTVRTLSHILLMAFDDSCPPAEDGEGEANP